MESSIGEFIKQAREKRGLSQRGLALKSGVNNATISRTEKNIGIPSPAVLTKLAPALGVPINVLMSLCGYVDSDITQEDLQEDIDGIITENDEKIIALYKSMTPKIQQAILDIMEDCANPATTDIELDSKIGRKYKDKK